MRKLTLALLVLFLAMACQNKQQDEEYPHPQVVTNLDQQEGVFIHITHAGDDVHRLLMAATLADKMSVDKDVIVYFDIEGVKAVLKDSEDFPMNAFKSSKALLKSLMKKGIDIMACPGCLKAAGKSADDLMEGVMVADKEKFFNFTDGRILTIDY
ncbi:MAG: DsrE family protein [Bacteroidales bacterium]|nr:DsrE family protein [Bacteroidales bacterium]